MDKRIGRPRKSSESLHKIKHNLRLILDMDRKLKAISEETGIPKETLLRSYANEGIRRDFNKINTMTA